MEADFIYTRVCPADVFRLNSLRHTFHMCIGV